MNKFIKSIFLFLMVVALFSLAGCGEEKPIIPDKPAQAEVKESVTKTVDDYLKTIIPSTVTESITLPEEYEVAEGKYCYIEWESNHKATISNKGVYKSNIFDQTVDLTATIIYDDLDDDIVLTYSVLAKGREDIEAYKKIIEDKIPDLVIKIPN